MSPTSRPSPGSGRPRPAAAFTLPEVLVALVIFTMAAVVLGAAYLNTLESYEAIKRGMGEDPDVAFARQQLLTQPTLATAESGEEWDTPAGRHVAWTATITPADTTDLFNVAFVCELTDSSPSSTRKVAENFMLLRPTWSDPTDESALRQAAANRIAQFQVKQQP